MQRRIDIDIASGFFVLWMINIHLGDWNWCTKTGPIDSLLKYLVIPFMPWFFYKAGMLAKQREIKDEIKYSAKKLLWPFLCITIISHLLYCLRLYFEFNETSLTAYIINPIAALFIRGASQGSAALWFLTSLFFVRVLYCAFYKYKYRNVILVLLSFVIASIVRLINTKSGLPIYTGQDGTVCPVWMVNIPLGLLFFSLGNILKDIQYNIKFFSISVISIVFLVAFFNAGLDFRTGSGDGLFLSWIIISTSAIIILNNVFRIVPFEWTRLQLIGKDAMVWYVLHWPLLTLSRLIFFTALEIPESWTLRIIQSVFILIATPLLSKSRIVSKCLSFPYNKLKT